MAASTSAAKFEEQLAGFTLEELHLLRWRMRWQRMARPKQRTPEGEWSTWGIRSGRGFGKTLTGANWIGIEAANDPGSYNFVIAPTFDDVRGVCFEGPTGLLSVIPPELVASYNASPPITITLWNRAIIRGFAAESPERLRGPQCHRGWCDEIASWREAQKVWDNYQFGLRLGTSPQTLWTGTPKPTPFVRNLIKITDVLVTGSTYENADNLPAKFFEQLKKYEGTSIGRQELYGDILDPEDSGYIRRAQWKLWPARKPLPVLKFVLLSLDTAFTAETFDKKRQTADPSACSVWGVFEQDGLAHVMLLDCWEERLGFPELVKRVKLERRNTYGAAQMPTDVGRNPLFGRPLIGKSSNEGRPVDVTLIEDKGSGISLRQQLAAEDVLTAPYNPGRMDKLARLHVISPMFAAGRVWAVESNTRPGEPRTWADPLISQVCTYVGEGSLEHDDLLDTTTQALKYISDKFMGNYTLPPPTKEQREREDVERRDRIARVRNFYG